MPRGLLETLYNLLLPDSSIREPAGIKGTVTLGNRTMSLQKHATLIGESGKLYVTISDWQVQRHLLGITSLFPSTVAIVPCMINLSPNIHIRRAPVGSISATFAERDTYTLPPRQLDKNCCSPYNLIFRSGRCGKRSISQDIHTYTACYL